MSFSRRAQPYTAWDGSQEPLPVDAEDVMNRISEDVFAGSDFEFAMRRILSSGWRTSAGSGWRGSRSWSRACAAAAWSS